MKSIKIGYQHDVITQYKKTKKGIKSTPQQFVVEGTWAYEKLIQTTVKIEQLIYCSDMISSKKDQIILHDLIQRAQNCYEISEKNMKRLCSKDNLQSMVMICSLTFKHQQYNNVIVLDGLENPGNIGTIFRSCDGAGIDAVFIVNEKATINQYKIIKASMGGYFNVPWHRFNSIESCMNYLKTHDFKLLLADPNQRGDRTQNQKTALVVGNERFGLSKDWYTYHHSTVSIPMRGCCDSLNVGVAASILIYHMMS